LLIFCSVTQSLHMKDRTADGGNIA